MPLVVLTLALGALASEEPSTWERWLAPHATRRLRRAHARFGAHASAHALLAAPAADAPAADAPAPYPPPEDGWLFAMISPPSPPPPPPLPPRPPPPPPSVPRTDVEVSVNVSACAPLSLDLALTPSALSSAIGKAVSRMHPGASTFPDLAPRVRRTSVRPRIVHVARVPVRSDGGGGARPESVSAALDAMRGVACTVGSHEGCEAAEAIAEPAPACESSAPAALLAATPLSGGCHVDTLQLRVVPPRGMPITDAIRAAAASAPASLGQALQSALLGAGDGCGALSPSLGYEPLLRIELTAVISVISDGGEGASTPRLKRELAKTLRRAALSAMGVAAREPPSPAGDFDGPSPPQACACISRAAVDVSAGALAAGGALSPTAGARALRRALAFHVASMAPNLVGCHVEKLYVVHTVTVPVATWTADEAPPSAAASAGLLPHSALHQGGARATLTAEGDLPRGTAAADLAPNIERALRSVLCHVEGPGPARRRASDRATAGCAVTSVHVPAPTSAVPAREAFPYPISPQSAEMVETNHGDFARCDAAKGRAIIASHDALRAAALADGVAPGRWWASAPMSQNRIGWISVDLGAEKEVRRDTSPR